MVIESSGEGGAYSRREALLEGGGLFEDLRYLVSGHLQKFSLYLLATLASTTSNVRRSNSVSKSCRAHIENTVYGGLDVEPDRGCHPTFYKPTYVYSYKFKK